MSADQLALIVTDPAVLHGQVHVKNSRIPVGIVRDCLAAGMTEGDTVDEYPALTLEGIRAAAAHGALLARDELLPPAAAE